MALGGVNGTQQVDTEAADFEANLTSLTQHVQRLNLRTSGGWGGKWLMAGCRSHAWMSRWKLGSMVSKWVISPTYKWGILGL